MHIFTNIKQKIRKKITLITQYVPSLSKKQIFTLVPITIFVLMLPIIVALALKQQIYQQRAASNTSLLPQSAQIAQMQILARTTGQALRIAPTGNIGVLTQNAQDHNKAMTFLMQNAPAVAVSESLTKEERSKLPESVQKYVEEQDTFTGQYIVSHADNFKTKTDQNTYVFKQNNDYYSLNFANGPPKNTPGETVKVNGVKLDSAIAVNNSDSTFAKVSNAVPAATTGVQKILLVNVNFNNKNLPAVTQHLTDAFFKGYNDPTSTSINHLVYESSYHALHFEGKDSPAGDEFSVTIPVAYPTTTDDCHGVGFWFWQKSDAWHDWASKANDQIRQKYNPNFNPSDYNHIVYTIPYTTACYWSGIADSTPGTMVMINGYNGDEASQKLFDVLWKEVVAHEIGHNLGFDHAGSLQCTKDGKKVQMTGDCINNSNTRDEYGDDTSPMGTILLDPDPNTRVSFYQYDSYRKSQAHWLSDSHIKTVTNDSLVKLYPEESLLPQDEQGNPYITSIVAPREQGRVGGVLNNYEIDYVQPIGTFDSLNKTDHPSYYGVVIRVVNSSRDSSQDNRHTWIVRNHPEVSDDSSFFFHEGDSFYDPDNNVFVYIKQLVPGTSEIDHGYAMVEVTFGKNGQKPCMPPSQCDFSTISTTPIPNLCAQQGGKCINVETIKGKYKLTCPPVNGQQTIESSDITLNNSCESIDTGSTCCLPNAPTPTPTSGPVACQTLLDNHGNPGFCTQPQQACPPNTDRYPGNYSGCGAYSSCCLGVRPIPTLTPTPTPAQTCQSVGGSCINVLQYEKPQFFKYGYEDTTLDATCPQDSTIDYICYRRN